MSRTVICHAKHENFDVYIGRTRDGGGTLRNSEPGESWGNPYRLEDHSRKKSIKKFVRLLDDQLTARPVLRLHLADLSGQRLGCFCRRSDDSSPPCHGDVLAARAESLRDGFRRGPACEGEHTFVDHRRVIHCADCGFRTQSLPSEEIDLSDVRWGDR